MSYVLSSVRMAGEIRKRPTPGPYSRPSGQDQSPDVGTVAPPPQSARFDANEEYQSTVSLGALSSYTLSFWGRIAVDRNANQTFIALDNGSNSAFHLQTDTDGVSLAFWDDPGGGIKNATHPALTVGTWYFIAISVTGTTGTIYYMAEGAGSLNSTALSGMTATRTVGRIDIGSNFNGTEFLNGNVAAIKLWTGAALTSTELLAEAAQYDAVRTTNLSRAWRLNGTVAEQSGNGTSLTGGATATWETGPNIPLTATATTHQGATSLTAEATLSVGATLEAEGVVGLTATPALTANGVRVVDGAVTLSQTPTLTVSGAVSQPGAAVLTAAASLTAVGMLGAAGAVSFVITSTLSAGAQLTAGGAVALTTSQSLLLTPLLGGFGVASLSALPSLTVSSIRITSASVNLSSSPTLLVSASQVMVASVGMVATGVLSVTAGSVIGNVSLVVGKTLSVAGTLQAFGAVSLPAVYSLSVSGVRTTFGLVTLSAVPVLTVAVSVGITNGSASLAALGTLSVNGIRVLNVTVGGVPLVAVGLLNVNGSTGSGGGTNLSATSTLLVSGVRVLFSAAQLNALPVISLGGIAIEFGTLTLTIDSSLAVVGVVSRIGAITLVVSSTITTQLFGIVVGAVALPIGVSLLFIDLFPEVDFGSIGGWSIGVGVGIHVDSRPYPRTRLSPSWTTVGTHVGSVH